MIAKLDFNRRFVYCNDRYRALLRPVRSGSSAKRLVDAVGEEHFAPRRPFIEQAYAG